MQQGTILGTGNITINIKLKELTDLWAGGSTRQVSELSGGINVLGKEKQWFRG